MYHVPKELRRLLNQMYVYILVILLYLPFSIFGLQFQGAIPATIAVLKGQVHVGLSSDMLENLANDENVVKISRRDFPLAISKRMSGGTTVAGTMMVANKVSMTINHKHILVITYLVQYISKVFKLIVLGWHSNICHWWPRRSSQTRRVYDGHKCRLDRIG